MNLGGFNVKSGGVTMKNGGLIMKNCGLTGFNALLYGVIKHGWLENPRPEWRLLAGQITDTWSIFQQAMFDHRKV